MRLLTAKLLSFKPCESLLKSLVCPTPKGGSICRDANGSSSSACEADDRFPVLRDTKSRQTDSQAAKTVRPHVSEKELREKTSCIHADVCIHADRAQSEPPKQEWMQSSGSRETQTSVPGSDVAKKSNSVLARTA